MINLQLLMYASSQSTLSKLSYDMHVAYVIFYFQEDTGLQKVLEKDAIPGAEFSLPLAFPFPSPFPSPSQRDGLACHNHFHVVPTEQLYGSMLLFRRKEALLEKNWFWNKQLLCSKTTQNRIAK